MAERTRKSPIGYKETDTQGTAMFDDPDALASTYGGFYVKDNSWFPKENWVSPSSRYTKEAWDDENAKTHERIHQGQAAAQLPANDNVLKLIKSALSGYPVVNNSRDILASDELPAYAFSTPRNGGATVEETLSGKTGKELTKKQQEAYNKYMDLVQKLAPGKRHNVMAPTPIELQRGYINSGPGQEGLALPNIPEESLLSIIKRSLGSK